MAARRVAITGLGIISPLGLNLADNWQCLREGRSAIGPDHVPNSLERQSENQNGAASARVRSAEAF